MAEATVVVQKKCRTCFWWAGSQNEGLCLKEESEKTDPVYGDSKEYMKIAGTSNCANEKWEYRSKDMPFVEIKEDK